MRGYFWESTAREEVFQSLRQFLDPPPIASFEVDLQIRGQCTAEPRCVARVRGRRQRLRVLAIAETTTSRDKSALRGDRKSVV